jgi:type I restriction enzyme M protein
LKKDIKNLQERIAAIEPLFEEIGGIITDEEAKMLILRKHHDLVSEQLNRYINAAKRGVIQVFDNLWDKYAVAANELQMNREITMTELENLFLKLNYFGLADATEL